MQCKWDAPDGSRSVTLSYATVGQLRTLAVDALLSLPKKGREIGGLLLGRTQAGDPTRVWVDAFEEIPCEYRYGPSYTLSADDRALLAKVLALRRPEGSPGVVGFYRTYTRRDAELDAADQELLEAFFPQEHCVFLLLEPLSPVECYATFLFHAEGSVPARSPYPFFAFDPQAMESHAAPEQPVGNSSAGRPRATEQPRSRAAPLPAAPLPAAPLPPPRWRLAESGESRPPRRGRVWLSLLACMVLSLGAGVIYELWRLAPQWADLRLDATQAGGRIELNWDRSAPAVVLASRGALSVNDGPSQKSIDLTSADLRSGRYDYQPAHTDVLFRMALYGPGIKPWSDSLRVVGQSFSPPVPEGEASRTEPPPSVPADPPGPVTAAVPLHQEQPRIPAGIRSRITTLTVVPVEVRVGRSGRVTSAVPLAASSSIERYLGEAAARAAHSWRFAPAKTGDGTPIASRKTIHFTFTPAEGR